MISSTGAVHGLEPRDPLAHCHRCGQPGTTAVVRRGDSPHAPGGIFRYCAACWPAAQTALEAEQERLVTAWLGAMAAGDEDPATNPPPSLHTAAEL